MAEAPETVDDYIAARSAPVRATLEALRTLVHTALPGAVEGMKWGAPVFSNANGQVVVYLYGGKDHANLGFTKGVELEDPPKTCCKVGANPAACRGFPARSGSRGCIDSPGEAM